MLTMIPPVATPVSAGDLAAAGAFLCGNRRESLERLFSREYKGRAYALSSARAGLFAVFSALRRLTGRKEVVVPANTCPEVAFAAIHAGCTIVPCDIAPESVNMSVDDLSRCVSRKTLCVVPAHLFGCCCEIDVLRRMAEENGTWLVEDAAQALGAVYKGKKVGTFGHASIFSFGIGKNITGMEGGMLLVNDESIAGPVEEQLAGFRSPAPLRSLLVVCLVAGYILFKYPAAFKLLSLVRKPFDDKTYRPVIEKCKISSAAAACVLNQMKRLQQITESRQEKARMYSTALSSVQNIKTFSCNEGASLFYPICFSTGERRDAAYISLRKKGFMTGRGYRKTVEGWVQPESVCGRECRNAESFSKTLLALSTAFSIRQKTITVIADILRMAVGS